MGKSKSRNSDARVQNLPEVQNGHQVVSYIHHKQSPLSPGSGASVNVKLMSCNRIPPECQRRAFFCCAFRIHFPTTKSSNARRPFFQRTPTVVWSPWQDSPTPETQMNNEARSFFSKDCTYNNQVDLTRFFKNFIFYIIVLLSVELSTSHFLFGRLHLQTCRRISMSIHEKNWTY